MKSLTRESFVPCLRQRFSINLPEVKLTAELVEVKPLGQPFQEGAREPFSLLFEAGAAHGLLNQGTYSLVNEVLGEREIFLVPVGERDNCYQYEAIFN
jgi:hypothetical protein